MITYICDVTVGYWIYYPPQMRWICFVDNIHLNWGGYWILSTSNGTFVPLSQYILFLNRLFRTKIALTRLFIRLDPPAEAFRTAGTNMFSVSFWIALNCHEIVQRPMGVSSNWNKTSLRSLPKKLIEVFIPIEVLAQETHWDSCPRSHWDPCPRNLMSFSPKK